MLRIQAMYFGSIRGYAGYTSYCVTIKTGIFPAKMCSHRRKNHGCGQTKTRRHELCCIWGQDRCEMLRKLFSLLLSLLKGGSPCDFRVISSVYHLILLILWCGRSDVRTDVHVTITSLPKFLGLMGYQICLAMVLRWRATRTGYATIKERD